MEYGVMKHGVEIGQLTFHDGVAEPDGAFDLHEIVDEAAKEELQRLIEGSTELYTPTWPEDADDAQIPTRLGDPGWFDAFRQKVGEHPWGFHFYGSAAATSPG